MDEDEGLTDELTDEEIAFLNSDAIAESVTAFIDGRSDPSLSDADRIWNRACHPGFASRLPGDRALWAVLRFHGQVMNGGLDYAIDEDGYQEAAEAADGFRVLGGPELGDLLDEARSITGRVGTKSNEIDILDLTDVEAKRILTLSRRYSELVPNDAVLVEMFERHLAEHPEAFEPL